MGLEVCCTLGMLEQGQAEQLKSAGLTAYNHNLDTSREFYPNVISTRTYDERLKTLELVRNAGISVCSGLTETPFLVVTPPPCRNVCRKKGMTPCCCKTHVPLRAYLCIFPFKRATD